MEPTNDKLTDAILELYRVVTGNPDATIESMVEAFNKREGGGLIKLEIKEFMEICKIVDAIAEAKEVQEVNMYQRMREMYFFMLNNINLNFTKFPTQGQEFTSIIKDLMDECEHPYIEPEDSVKRFCEKCGELIG